MKYSPLLTFVFLCLLSSQSNAQLPNVKGLLDKAKERIESPAAAKPIPEPPRPNANNEPKSQQPTIINSDGSITITKSAFKSQWCSTIESQTLGPYDYKGVRPGDICGQPEEFIDILFPDGSITLNPKGLVVADLDSDVVRTKGFELTFVQLIYSANLKKMYITALKGDICKTNPANSLNPNNSFRSALVSKYGEPDATISAYDVGKAQYDALKKDIDASRNNAVTVQEAKRARDGQVQLESLNNMLKNPNLKNEIAQLNWRYKGVHNTPNVPFGMLMWEASHNQFQRRYCKSLEDQISFHIVSNAGMQKKIEEFNSISQKARESENTKAPVPKF